MKPPRGVFQKYGYFWATLGLFLFSIIGHWIFAWYAFVSNQEQHNQPIKVSEYVVEVGRDTFENWQSEFLQLIWQVAGLAILLHVGSPQSKEEGERLEDKMDAVLKAVDKDGEEIIKKLDKQYARK
jgi:hypothetical protein